MAQDEPAVAAEAAASLFDSGDDAGSLFFSSTSVSDVQLEHQSATAEDKSASHHFSSDTSNLFEAGPGGDASALFENISYDDPFSMTNNEQQWPVEQSQTEETASQSTYTVTDEAYASATQEYIYNQWQEFDSENAYTSTYDYTPEPSSNNYAQQVNSYSKPTHESAQSPSSYDTFTPATTYAASSQIASQQTYDPQKYAPSAAAPKPAYQQGPYQAYTSPYTSAVMSTPVYGQLTPPSHPSPATTYTPPTHAASTPASAYNAYAPSAYSSTTSNVNSTPAPQPPVQPPKDVSAYRSNTRNAYDPPIPTKSRVKSRHVSYAPTVAPNAYQQHQAPMQPPPLPPPQASTYAPAVAQSSYTTVQQHTPHTNSYTVERYQFDLSNGPAATTPRLSPPPPAPNKPVTNTETFGSNTNHVEGKTQTEIQDVEVSNNLPFERHQYLIADGDLVGPEVVGFSDDIVEDGQVASDEFAIRESMADGEKTAIPSTFGSYSISPPPMVPSPSNSVKSIGSPHKPNYQAAYDPYNPANQSRQNSVSSQVPPSQQGPSSTTPWDPYALPAATNKRSHRDSQSSVYNSYGASTAMNGNHSLTDSTDYTPNSVPQRSASRQDYVSYESGHAPQTFATVPEQSGSAYAVVTTTYNQGPYAPSPSLLGTNDPLGRTSVKIPVISFGFGGKFVSCFHSTGETASGFDVSLTSRYSTTISIRTLYDVIPASAMDSSINYPGPLYSDPGPSTLSLARTVGVGSASSIKIKKTAVSKWLEEQAEDLAKSVAHIPIGSQERHNTEGRLALISLLKVMIDHDGQLSGSPEIEWAVRKALISRLQNEASPDGAMKDLSLAGYGSTFADLNEQPLAVYTLKASSLDRIREFLVRGQRREAYHYAIDEKLWAHAMVIASSVSAQSWQEVVKEFIRSELGTKSSLLSLAEGKVDGVSPTSNGRESLRVAYSLFGGHGASSVQELVPPKPIPIGKESSLVAPGPGMHATPISPNFPQPMLTSSVPPETLAKWQETVAMMAFSGTPGDSAALTALGDYLTANRWTEAAHACYLLSPRTSAFGGAGLPSVRMVLVGSDSPTNQRGFFRDLDVTILSEIVEFALSLSTTKGQDGFCGLPHLQAYKLLRASHLAEMGYVELANRYCEAIGTSIRSSNRGSQFYTPTFLGELKNLSDRLTAAPQADKTVSWISKKMTKPSLDTLGSWLEGSFSRLIVGEGEESREAQANDFSQATKSAYGPFSHYSTISSINSSAAPSRTSTPYLPPATPGISTGPSIPVKYPHGPVDRAASAMDHLRPEKGRASPVQRVASASAATTTFSQAYAMLQSNDTGGQEVSWWSSNSQDRSGPTPTATTFHTSDENELSGNFTSLMDNVNVGPTASNTIYKSHSTRMQEDEDEDLGFGNSSIKNTKAPPASPDGAEKKTDEKPKEEPKKEEPTQQSGSWFSLSRWLGRSSSTPGPIKANLGEETSFYYDEELKRWVNKKVGAAAATPPPPPPPPSRPRTAGPSTEPVKGPDALVGLTPPPPRASSAAEISRPPRKPRARSNLVPQEENEALSVDDPPSAPGSAPPTATKFDTLHPMSDGPPMSRPKSAAAKRNVRSRYVDVFQQQQ